MASRSFFENGTAYRSRERVHDKITMDRGIINGWNRSWLLQLK